MLNNTIKVYGEDLVTADFADVPANGLNGNPVKIGDTQGALVVNVFAKGDVSLSSGVSVCLYDAASIDGGYTSLMTQTIESGITAKDGELMAVITFPADARDYLKVKIMSAQTNTGGVRVALGYWPR